MHLKAVAILCILLAAQGFAVRDVRGVFHRALKQSSSGSGGASGLQRGSRPVISVRDALQVPPPRSLFRTPDERLSLVGEVRLALAEAVAESIAEVENGEYPLAIAEVEANHYAVAIAEALSRVIAESGPTENGATACFGANGDVEPIAEDFSRVLVEVLAQASDIIDFAQADVAISAVFETTVIVYSQALSEACGTGLFDAATYIDALSTGLTVPFTEVMSLAFALTAPAVAVAPIMVTAIDNELLEVITVDERTADQVLAEADAGCSCGPGAAEVMPGP